MAANLSAEQRTEVDKILKYLKNIEGIIRTTPSAEQRARVQKEHAKYRDKLATVVPGFQPGNKNSDQIIQELDLGEDAKPEEHAAARGGSKSGGYNVLDKYKLERASPNSSDPDINFLSTVFNLIQREYWPALSEVHTKLDFSHGSERDGIRAKLENVLRNMKVLVETIEEYAGAEKQDFREQLLKMKNRQSRAFIYEANEILREIRDFLEKIVTDIHERGGICMNPSDKLQFNARFEDATALEGRSVADGLQEFYQLVQEAIEQLNLPQMKIKPPGS